MEPCKLVHNKLVQQFGTYKCIVFTRRNGCFDPNLHQLQVIVERWSTSKNHDLTSLNLTAIAKCGNPRPMTEAMKCYLGLKGLNTKYYALEGTICLYLPNGKLNLPHGGQCDSRSPDKLNCSIPHPNTRANIQARGGGIGGILETICYNNIGYLIFI